MNFGDPPKPGERRGGRKKGSRNKVTEQLRNAIMYVFRKRGGQQGMLEWAEKHQDLFYTRVLPLLLPKAVELTGADGKDLEPVRVVRVVVQQPAAPTSPLALNGHAHS
jgi:hypothetical protein